MDYYTMYELTVSDDKIDQHIGGIELYFGYSGAFEQTVKWYSHEQDIRAYSKDHPDVLFEIKGQGEEIGDLWVAYFKGGKMQQCKAVISYDDYDESKLC